MNQSILRLKRRFNAQVDFEQIERTFRRRIQHGWRLTQVSRAFEFNFDNPETEAEKRIKSLIDEYRRLRASEIEKELFEQKIRLNKANRDIEAAAAANKSPTKKALSDQRIATDKIEARERWIKDLWTTEQHRRFGRIYANHFVPVIVKRDGVNLIQLGRYLLRRRGKPASFDDQYSGAYNARLDNVQKFWRPEFGKTHCLLYVESFFENVVRNGKKTVAHFTPSDGREMIVACLYSDWGDESDGFLSIAAITDDPPDEVMKAGHDRIIINLDESAIEDWLSPQGKSDEDLFKILSNRARPYYNHEFLEAAA